MYDNFKLANYNSALLSPELYARHLSRLFTGDVIDGLTVTPGTGMQVILAPGNALVRYGSAAVASAREVSLVANFNLTIGTADVSNPRIDLVVLYVDNTVILPTGTPTSANLDGLGVAKAKIVQGTAAASPVAPNATAVQSSVGAGNPYTILAQVQVDAGVSVIASGKITDARSMAYSTAKVTSSNIDFTTGIWWEELGRTEITTNTATINVTIAKPKRYMKAYFRAFGSAAGVISMTINNVTAGSYNRAYITAAASGVAAQFSSNATALCAITLTGADHIYGELEYQYSPTLAKSFKVFLASTQDSRNGASFWTSASASTVPTSIQLTCASGTFTAANGGYIVVLGHD